MIGILLLNIGTPDNCDRNSVKRYLQDFLDDDNIIDINRVLRYILVNFIICPIRSGSVAKKYQTIWTKEGSPLLSHSKRLKEKMMKNLGDKFAIELGMIVGNPSIVSGLDKLMKKNCDEIVILPMFPQYSSVTNGSCISKAMNILREDKNVPNKIHIIKNFFDSKYFIESVCFNIHQEIADYKEYYFLFSYHGLPNNTLKKICKNVDTCNKISCVKDKNTLCYKSECYQTSDLVASTLGISKDMYCTTFQSRFGFAPWIEPYTDVRVKELRKRKVENLAIVCPAFTMDCLETLEEIGIDEKEAWKELGGKNFKLVPCVNDSDIWSSNLCKIISDRIK